MLTYICSRYRANSDEQFAKQLEYTKDKAKIEVLTGNDVIVPHLYYPLFLDDNIESERTLGMESAIRLMETCDRVLVCLKYGVSSGMLAEIAHAIENDIEIVEVA